MNRRKPLPPQGELAANPEWEPFVQMQRQHLLDLRDRALDNMSGVARDTLRNHPEGSEASGLRGAPGGCRQ